jgi:hypothetical protein
LDLRQRALTTIILCRSSRKGRHICGPSNAEYAAQNEQTSLTSSIQAAFNGRFASQTQINNLLQNSLTPIAEAGPSQQGISPQELASLNTSAIDTNAAAARNARQAAGNAFAGQGGGGTSGLESGIQAQVSGAINATESGNLANTQNQIVQKNYDVGRQNWQTAEAGLSALSGQMNPGQFSGQAIQSNQAAFQQADTIAQQKNQEEAEIAGMATSGVEALAGGIGNLDTTGSSTGFEQFQNFLSGI